MPTKNVKLYPNNKIYITKDQAMNLRKMALKKKDNMELQRLKKELTSKILKAKEVHMRYFEEANNPVIPRKFGKP